MQFVVNVIVLVSLYCLVCSGYVLVYRASRVLNLAHGELMALGGYFLLTMIWALPFHPALNFGAALAMSVLLGLGVYFFLMRFMTGQSVIAAVLVTIALGILLRSLVNLIWTAQAWHPMHLMGLENRAHELWGEAVISTMGLVGVGSALVLYLSLFICLKYTRWGLRIRAVGEKPLLASQRGIDLHKYYALSWTLASFSAGLAGMIQACDSGLEPEMIHIALTAFPVVLVGGLDSLAGVIPGAVVVATAQVIAIFLSPQTSEVAPFLILILVLLVRPWGIFGTKEEWDRV